MPSRSTRQALGIPNSPATWIAAETGAAEDLAVRSLETIAERKVGKARLWLLRLAA